MCIEVSPSSPWLCPPVTRSWCTRRGGVLHVLLCSDHPKKRHGYAMCDGATFVCQHYQYTTPSPGARFGRVPPIVSSKAQPLWKQTLLPRGSPFFQFCQSLNL